MAAIPYVQFDVFTDRLFGGNPLAVFPQPGSIPTTTMQALARETNLSETTFITGCDKENNAFSVRIFTPTSELPFAGHPTVGTSAYIFENLATDADQITLKLAAGDVPVWREKSGPLPLVYFKAPEPKYGKPIADLAKLASLVSLPVDAIATDVAQPQQISNGPNFCIIPLRNREPLEAAVYNGSGLPELEERYGFNQVTVFCTEPYRDESAISTRMFAADLGVPEDPATGSSAACLAHFLRSNNVIADTGDGWFGIDQGYSIRRPSLIYARANNSNAGVDIHIGGYSVQSAEGSYETG